MKPLPVGIENLGVLMLWDRYGLDLSGKKETRGLAQDGIGIVATKPSAFSALNACVFLRNIVASSE